MEIGGIILGLACILLVVYVSGQIEKSLKALTKAHQDQRRDIELLERRLDGLRDRIVNCLNLIEELEASSKSEEHS